MKTGQLVYLCEDYFSKFREIFEWMRSKENCLNFSLSDGTKIIKQYKIQNKFYIVANFYTKALISLKDSCFDFDLVSNTPYNRTEEFYVKLNQYSKYAHRSLTLTNEIINGIVISEHLNTKVNYLDERVPLSNLLFLFDVEKLTVIE